MSLERSLCDNNNNAHSKTSQGSPYRNKLETAASFSLKNRHVNMDSDIDMDIDMDMDIDGNTNRKLFTSAIRSSSSSSPYKKNNNSYDNTTTKFSSKINNEEQQQQQQKQQQQQQITNSISLSRSKSYNDSSSSDEDLVALSRKIKNRNRSSNSKRNSDHDHDHDYDHNRSRQCHVNTSGDFDHHGSNENYHPTTCKNRNNNKNKNKNDNKNINNEKTKKKNSNNASYMNREGSNHHYDLEECNILNTTCVQEEHEQEQEQEEENQQPLSTSFPSCHNYNNNVSYSSSDDDLVKANKKLQQRKNNKEMEKKNRGIFRKRFEEERHNKRNINNDDDDDQGCSTNKYYDGDNGDDDDSMVRYTNFEDDDDSDQSNSRSDQNRHKRKGRGNDQAKWTTKSTPNQVEDSHFEGIMNGANIIGTKRNENTLLEKDPADEVDLWDDSSEQEQQEDADATSKLPSESKKCHGKKNVSETHKNRDSLYRDDRNDGYDYDSRGGDVIHKRNRNEKAKTSRGIRRGRKSQRRIITKAQEEKEECVSDDEFSNDEELEQSLWPEIETPKWKSELVPLKLLCRSGDEDGDNLNQNQVPASINRYLHECQREGIEFMHSSVMKNEGAILGHDMGLGKTVQLISLLAALQKKSGTKKDMKVIKDKLRLIEQELREKKNASEEALLKGSVIADVPVQIQRTEYSPVLIIVPPSVVDNWCNEFTRWGYFSIEVIGKEVEKDNRALCFNRVKTGMKDILITGKALFSKSFDSFMELNWKLVVIDEFHEYKNNKTKAFECVEKLRNKCSCPLIGLTGTLMSNDYRELWNLVDLIRPGFLGSWKDFNTEFVRPIKLARAKDAKQDVCNLGNNRNDQLFVKLKKVHLKRNKDEVLEDDLPTKAQQVLFCEPSDLQKQIYQHILSLPEYRLLHTMNSPCDCGVNLEFFRQYQRYTKKKEKIQYYRTHKKNLIRRKECCYKYPYSQNKNGKETIDPRAVFWLSQHKENEIGSKDFCKNCPSCILLPALNKLYKLCSHVSLLQVGQDPDKVDDEEEKERASKELKFAKLALKPFLEQLPGKSYIRETSIMDDHSCLSGKMKNLAFCLEKYEKNSDRVLVFSSSTQTLDFIEQFIKEKGYSHLRLDGTTPTRKRQTLIDEFQRNNSIFLFLISTKAGGLGLNLTAANRVIIYDVSWNPSHDEQAQDRAFRIGQKRDVDVVRLVAKGTIEELKYARQVYKVHLTQQTLKSHDEYSHVRPARLFRGVDKDQNRKGELFGCENLLKFKDGSFMEDLWQASDNAGNKRQIHDESELVNALRGVNEAVVQNGLVDEDEGIVDAIQEMGMKGYNHEDFLREDRGAAALNLGDEGFDEELGGSQVHHFACDSACKNIDDRSDEDALLNELERSLLENPSSPPKNREQEREIHDREALRQTSMTSQDNLVARKQKRNDRSSNAQDFHKAGQEHYRKQIYEARRKKSLFADIKVGQKKRLPWSSLGIYRPAYLDDNKN